MSCRYMSLQLECHLVSIGIWKPFWVSYWYSILASLTLPIPILCQTFTGGKRMLCRECLHAEKPAIGLQQCTDSSTVHNPITCPVHCCALQMLMISLAWECQIQCMTHTSWLGDHLLATSSTLDRELSLRWICDLHHTTYGLLYCPACKRQAHIGASGPNMRLRCCATCLSGKNIVHCT